MKLSPGLRPNLWHFLPCPETKGPWTTHHTLPGSGRPPSHLQPRSTVSSKLPTSSLQILPWLLPTPAPNSSPVSRTHSRIPPWMLTVGASLLSDSLLRVTISPAAPLPSRLRGSASQLCSWPPPTTSPRLSHSPTVTPRPRYQQLQPATPVLSSPARGPAPPPAAPRSGLQESGCTDPSLSILATTQVNPAGPAAEYPLPLPQSLLHGPLLPGENARSLKGTPSVCTYRPSSSLRPSLLP